ncbi:MAG: GNAT family N-acetyltransferase [Phycisphaerae bacterium]
MAVEPIEPKRRVRLWLRPYVAAHAPLIADWVGGAQDAYWLAPRTPPPITAAIVSAWSGEQTDRRVLVDEHDDSILAYGELNLLSAVRRVYWLGHLIVDPQRRGVGLGCRLTQLLIERAFTRYGAKRLTLVVFRENESAIRCYEAAGMRPNGWETHYFPEYKRRVRLMRMAVNASDWA